MPTQVIITLHDGTLVRGLSYRMDPGFPASPSVPLSYTSGQYHVETANGWIDIDGAQVQNVSMQGTRST